MIVGVMQADLHLQGISSLKQKRSIVKSLISRLKSRFNISVSEVDRQASHFVHVILIIIVWNETRFVNRQFDKIIDFMRKDGRFYMGQIERETF